MTLIIYRKQLDCLNFSTIANEFSDCNDGRKSAFGSIKSQDYEQEHTEMCSVCSQT